MWPADAEALEHLQRELGAAAPEPWRPATSRLLVGGVWVCFQRGLTGPGAAGDPAWAGAVVLAEGRVVGQRVVPGVATAPYAPGLLALRTGPLMEEVVRGLATPPDVVLLDASGRDHPRRAGLAVHLGAVLDLPTVGVTHRPLVGEGEWPRDSRGATSALRIGDEVVAAWVRTREGTRPLVVHPGWRVGLTTAVGLVESVTRGRRTPEPLRAARRLARTARDEDTP